MQEFERPPEYQDAPPERPTLMAANASYLFAAVGGVMLGVIFTLMIQMLREINPATDVSWMQNLYQATFEIVLLAFPPLFFLTRHKNAAEVFRLNPITLSMLLTTALLAVVGGFLMNDISVLWALMIQSLGGQLSGSDIVAAGSQSELVAQVFVIGVLPGVCEELMFRSYVMSAWERRGTRCGLIVSSLLFAALHGSVEGIPVHFLTGFVLGWLVLSSGSVYTSMIYHTTYNSMIVIISYVQAQTVDVSETPTDIAAYIAQNGGMGYLLGWTALFAILFFLILLLMTSIWRRNASPVPPVAADKRPMSWRALVVLIAGVLTVACMYLLDFLKIAGVPVGL